MPNFQGRNLSAVVYFLNLTISGDGHPLPCGMNSCFTRNHGGQQYQYEASLNLYRNPDG